MRVARRFPTGSAAHTGSNPMPPILDAANAYATVDVASGRPSSAFGAYREA
jgi:methylmalonyl-CoA mutase N-terminal domain/subunit